MTVSSKDETPVVFAGGGEDLVGIFTRPPADANGVAVISMWGGGGIPAFGRNQARMRLSRELAARGFHVLRFSYPGVAESGGAVRDVDLERPWADEAIGAVRWLESQGFHEIILIGLCAGGRAALAAAHRVVGLTGLALISSPVGERGHREAVLEQPVSWYLKRGMSTGLFRRVITDGKAKRRRRILTMKLRRLLLGSGPRRSSGTDVRRMFLPQLQAELERGTPVLLLYGSSDDFYPQFEIARGAALGRLLEQSGDRVSVQVADARFDGLASVASQQTFLETVISWASAVVRRGSGMPNDADDDGILQPERARV